jgi:two-component sensor histidine kinase
VFASLRSRIVLILIAAVAPAAILVCIFAYRTYDDARSMQYASLDRDAEFLISRLDVVPQSAVRMAQTLASIRAFTPETEACEDRIREVMERYDAFSAFATVTGGQAGCAYTKPGALSVGDIMGALPRGAMQHGKAGNAVVTLPDGRHALVALAPLGAPGGDAVVALIVDQSYLERLISEFHSTPSSVAEILTADGKVVIASQGARANAVWPPDPLPLQERRRIAAGTSAGGDTMVYTVGRFASVDLWLATAQHEADVLGLPRRQLLVTALAPLIMILAAVMAIWIGLHGSVLRWVTALGKATRAYSAGAMTSRVGDASAAPIEFAELAGSFDRLADRVAERTLDLEREVASKTNYIREIHHRVKNNLQVIGSLLALQKRELPQDQRAVLRFPEDRVNAMSAAYRASYAVSEIGQVPIGNVVREVSHRLQTSGDARNVRFDLDFSGSDNEVDLDTAVSIAMLLAEILPAYADSAERTQTPVKVTLKASPDRVSLLIRGHASTERQSFHLAKRFIQAYLRQLNATLDEATPGETLIEAPFPRPTRPA